MASFEPFVSSDPFNMETFNSKLGGAFEKVDKNVKSALLTPVLLYSGEIGTTEVSFTTPIPENAKFIMISTNNILNNFSGILPIIDESNNIGFVNCIGGATSGSDPNIWIKYFYLFIVTRTGIKISDSIAIQMNKNSLALSGYSIPMSALVKVYAF